MVTLRPPAKLAFLHVPKTAGSSLIAAIVGALQPDTVVSGFDRVLFGTFADFASLDANLQQAVFRDPAQIPNATLLAGHLALSSLRHHGASRPVMTVLREPVSRLLSHWLFWRGHTDERLAPWGAWADQVRLSRLNLEAFLSADTLACQNDNLVVRMLLWPHPDIPDGGFIHPRHDRRLLAQARRACRSLAFADLVENPDLAGNIGRFLGRTVTVARSNETSPLPETLRRPLEEALPPAAFAALSSLTRLDRAIWQDVLRQRLPKTDDHAFREHVLMRNVARFARLMAG